MCQDYLMTKQKKIGSNIQMTSKLFSPALWQQLLCWTSTTGSPPPTQCRNGCSIMTRHHHANKNTICNPLGLSILNYSPNPRPYYKGCFWSNHFGENKLAQLNELIKKFLPGVACISTMAASMPGNAQTLNQPREAICGRCKPSKWE